MADIIITCQNCGNAIPVSEFVDGSLLVCMKCKAKVTVPDHEVAPVPHHKLRLAVEKPPEPPPQPVAPPLPKKNFKGKPVGQNDVGQYLPKAKKRVQKRRSMVFEAKVLPWLIFFILTAILCWLRYVPGALPADTVDTLTRWGVIALLFLHITIICYAFGDEAFYGILCLIIPGYSLYYLYIQADEMILRSVTGALLVAFGWDAVIATQQLWAEVYATVSLWIATTDTIKK